MSLRGMCLVCEKRRDDCVPVRFEGDLPVYCRACQGTDGNKEGQGKYAPGARLEFML